ncbi:cytochrome P450 [Mycolicibacterium chlorophenolicum]|uniref:Putative cytochrome P450 142 n=1 Tax=Mycolicibacterium chlorophenolicum TaxID=37916 RepID=A0A0J6V9T2_9MYCO|nr:cytochrome P450 [Mycolicibacterium chlorophenolicum]KMO66974.1 putative cytochrome P450 142 [Mycolicibacterium chlorophenolicum]
MVGLDFDESVEVRHIAITMFDSIGTTDFPANMDAFVAFYTDKLRARRVAPRDDYLTMLAHGEVDGVAVDEPTVNGIMVAFLLAGHHSTATGIAGLLGHVLVEAGLRDRVAADSKLLSRVIEESLRLVTPLQFFARTVHGTAMLGGVALEEGTRVMMNLAAANRDGRQFDEPDRFNPQRSPNPHVAFGGGLHVCVGHNLARAEMRVAVRELLRRLPDVRLVGEVTVAGMQSGQLMPVTSVPVEFTAEPVRS